MAGLLSLCDTFVAEFEECSGWCLKCCTMLVVLPPLYSITAQPTLQTVLSFCVSLTPEEFLLLDG